MISLKERHAQPYVGENGESIGMRFFGASAPLEVLAEEIRLYS
jgi:hypothetical protein